MQKSIIVSTEGGNAILNQYLEDGWKVVTMSGMPSSCAVSNSGTYNFNQKESYPPTCLVIIEKVD